MMTKAAGNAASRASIARQIAAGMPIPIRNWRSGDQFWWLASGCYTNTWPVFVGLQQAPH